MEKFKTNHPQINEVVSLYFNESQPFRKIHRMIDAFEVIIKTHTAYIIGEYFRSKDISDDIKGLFTEGLRTPSLGMWHLFNRVLTDELVFNDIASEIFHHLMESIKSNDSKKKLAVLYTEKNGRWTLKSHLELQEVKNWRGFLIKNFLPEIIKFQNHFLINYFPIYFYKWMKKVDVVIKLRNKYAHGATPSDEQCLNDLQAFQPVLEEWLEAKWLGETTIVPKNQNFQAMTRPMLRIKNESIDLFPIMKYENKSLVFFNDLKKFDAKKISYLDYRFAEHIHDALYYQAFLEVFRMDEWKLKKTNEFQLRIDELTENFKGREAEQLEILQFIKGADQDNFLFISGIPGVGKSAIIANFSLESNKNHHLIKYFIRRGTIYDSPMFFLDYMIKQMEGITGKLSKKAISLDDKMTSFHEMLQSFSAKRPNQKLIIMIDGLDEGVEQKLLTYIPKQNYKNVKFIYSGRKTEKTEELYHLLPVENKRKMTLNGLSNENIRALLYEVVSKYSVTDEDVEIIADQSKGNPLYLKVLCDAIERGEIQLTNLSVLPKKIEGFYEAILYRLAKEEDGDDIINGLFVLGAAKDFLTREILQQMLQIGPAKGLRVLASLREILYFSKENQYKFQLFHESLREYLVKEHPLSMKNAERTIITYCEGWEELITVDEAQALYPLRYYSTHLINQNEIEKLNRLALNNTFLKEQQKLLTTQFYSFLLMQQSLSTFETSELDQFVQVAVQNAKLHIDASSRGLSLLQKIRNVTKDSIIDIFKELEETSFEEQIILYIALIYYCLNDKEGLKKELIVKVIERFVELMHEIGPDQSLEDFIPVEFLFELIVRLEDFNLNSSVIGDRIVSFRGSRFPNILERLKNIKEYKLYLKYFVDPSDDKVKCYRQIIFSLEDLNSESLKNDVIEDIHRYIQNTKSLYDKCMLNLLLSKYYYRLGKLLEPERYIQPVNDLFVKITDIEIQSEILLEMVHYYLWKDEIENFILFVKKAKTFIRKIDHPRARWGKRHKLCLACITDKVEEEKVIELIEFIDPNMVEEMTGILKKRKLASEQFFSKKMDDVEQESTIDKEIMNAKSLMMLHQKKEAYADIAVNLYKSNKIDMIFEIILSQFQLDKLNDDRDSFQEYKAISIELIKSGKNEEVFELIKIVEKNLPKDSFHLLRGLKRDLANLLLEKQEYTFSLKIIQTVQFEWVEEEIEYLLREYHYFHGKKNKEQMDSIFAKIKAMWSKVDRHDRLFKFLIENKYILEAMECLQQISDERVRNENKVIIIKGLIENNHEMKALEFYQSIPDKSINKLSAAMYLFRYYEEKQLHKDSKSFKVNINHFLTVLEPNVMKRDCYEDLLDVLIELHDDKYIQQIAGRMMADIEEIQEEVLKYQYCCSLHKKLLECDRVEYFTSIKSYLVQDTYFFNWYSNHLGMYYIKKGNYKAIEELAKNSFGDQQRLLFVGLIRMAHTEKDFYFIIELLNLECIYKQVKEEMFGFLIERYYILNGNIALRLIINIMRFNCQNLNTFSRAVYGLTKFIRFLTSYENSVKNDLLQKLNQICHVDHLFVESSTRWTFKNLSEWIGKIEDQDDAEDIQIWARRVEKNKMTEERFNELIQEIISD